MDSDTILLRRMLRVLESMEKELISIDEKVGRLLNSG